MYADSVLPEFAWASPLGLWFLAQTALAAWRAPWKALLARNERQHAFIGCVLLLPLLWAGQIEVAPDVTVHLLGMTAVVLVFGPALALVLGALACVVLAALGAWTWKALPLAALLSVTLPVVVTHVLWLAADRLPRQNLFVYLLGVGFLGGVISMVASLLLGGWMLGWLADHALVLLLAFPEGFIAGTVVTALAVFYPAIVRSYDEDRYLGPP